MENDLVMILSGICVAIISGVIGKTIGSKGRMTETHCSERQVACQNLMSEKIDHLCHKVDNLIKMFSKSFPQDD